MGAGARVSVRGDKVIHVLEHNEAFGPLGRAAFMEEWYKLTGWTIPNELSLMNYWLRNGGYTRQAG